MADSAIQTAFRAFSEGRPEEAISVLQTINESLPPPNYFALKALCYGATGRSGDVVPFLRREVVVHPENQTALQLLSAIESGAADQATAAVQALFSACFAPRQPDRGATSESPRVFSHQDLTAAFPNTEFGNSVQVTGIANIMIDRGSCIGDGTWLNVCLRDGEKRMRIGRCVLIGRQSMISTGGHLELGDYCLLAPRVYLSDADHTFSDLTMPVFSQPATLHRRLTIEENCWLGINTVISGSLTVGRGSVVAANSVVLDDVPPFCVVAGNPARPIKMLNPVSGRWERTRTEGDLMAIQVARETRPLPSREEYRETLRRNAPFDRIDAVLSGRGFCF